MSPVCEDTNVHVDMKNNGERSNYESNIDPIQEVRRVFDFITGLQKSTGQVNEFPDDINPVTKEKGGPRGPEPTRYGDWERKGRCIDF
ncbi:Hypothetical predicted protein [Lynx pardinus]|uniref:Succinate dehydrogenase assembly factor 4, mitochondrial n=1 Tax=Lynx pardinus TaxID=191816 RepID=A0A485PL00_LYNPA|nr:Hypothetical predicted protein [Lynx pardinus]